MLCYELFLFSSALRANKIVRIFNGVVVHFIDYLKNFPILLNYYFTFPDRF